MTESDSKKYAGFPADTDGRAEEIRRAETGVKTQQTDKKLMRKAGPFFSMGMIYRKRVSFQL
eukprot:763364-Hanusia_phi.AAC.2